MKNPIARRFPLTVIASTALAALALLPFGSAFAADDPVSFEADVWPILEVACVNCHGSKEQFSNLRLDSPEAIMRGGDLGEVLVPSEPENSSLYTRTALPDDDLDLMPVEGDRLNEEQQEILRRWVAEGADFGGWNGS